MALVMLTVAVDDDDVFGVAALVVSGLGGCNVQIFLHLLECFLFLKICQLLDGWKIFLKPVESVLSSCHHADPWGCRHRCCLLPPPLLLAQVFFVWLGHLSVPSSLSKVNSQECVQ